MKPDPELLREIGENSTNVEGAWAGAANDLARGLNTWTRSTIGRDRNVAVRAALVACSLVTDRYASDKPGLPSREYIETMLAGIRRWLDDPTRDNTEAVRSALDVTRSAHAWQQDEDALTSLAGSSAHPPIREHRTDLPACQVCRYRASAQRP